MEQTGHHGLFFRLHFEKNNLERAVHFNSSKHNPDKDADHTDDENDEREHSERIAACEEIQPDRDGGNDEHRDCGLHRENSISHQATPDQQFFCLLAYAHVPGVIRIGQVPFFREVPCEPSLLIIQETNPVDDGGVPVHEREEEQSNCRDS